MGDEAVFHQLFVSRVAMFAFSLLFLGVAIYEAPFATQSDAPMQEMVGWSAFAVAVLWFSWRNWRLGVRLSSSEIHIMGLFRDRKIARENVLDVTPWGQLVWIAPAGEVQVSQLIAFTDLSGGAVAGIVIKHNERTLAQLREKLVGPPVERHESAAPAEDRTYDPPTYRRRRDRSGPGKRAGRQRVFRDAWLAILQLLGWGLCAAAAVWLAVEAGLWLAGHQSGTLRSALSLDPYTESSAMGDVIFWSLAAAALLGNTLRLAYLTLRPGRG